MQQDPHFKVFPSLRFEYFLTLLFHSEFIIGNSSAGIREAPYYRIPTIDIGTRQLNRAQLKSIVHADYDKASIKEQIETIENIENHDLNSTGSNFFGRGNSDRLFLEILDSGLLWKLGCQKQFQEAHYD
ncbi:UDP-N-acetylglucosamine 2-epimerase [Vibrio variabilis]|uniref:UDP-N-acetylglucosamine 2-epimerase n=1 Tax=Vibrio variabilis TaxID=990271 RepID=A0ABQ0JFJ5_9VIBR|nr:UDP-N-acetylglucosamine 2-epimerase [Vibrio variabilis]